MRILNVVTWLHKGKYIQPNTTYKGLFTLNGYYEPHLLAKILGATVRFYLRYWQWVWGMIVAILSSVFHDIFYEIAFLYPCQKYPVYIDTLHYALCELRLVIA